jgi:hypothetical protein
MKGPLEGLGDRWGRDTAAVIGWRSCYQTEQGHGLDDVHISREDAFGTIMDIGRSFQ